MCGMTRRSARDFQVWRGKSGRQEKPFYALRVAIPLTRSAMDAEEESEQLERDGKKFEMEEPSTENLKLTWRPGSYNIKSRRDGKIERELSGRELGLLEKVEPQTREVDCWDRVGEGTAIGFARWKKGNEFVARKGAATWLGTGRRF